MAITTLYISSDVIKFLVTRGNREIARGNVMPASPIKNGLILQPDVIADSVGGPEPDHGVQRGANFMTHPR